MLFSSVLMLGLWEVVSVVDQFSHVSKVNTLCVTQICKCLRHKAGFFLDTYRARLLPPRAGGSPSLFEHSTLAPQPSRWQHERRSRRGGWICILWVSEQRPKQRGRVIQPPLAPAPPAFLALSAVLANNGRRGRLSTHFCSSPPQRGSPPKPLLGRDVFTPFFLFFLGGGAVWRL